MVDTNRIDRKAAALAFVPIVVIALILGAFIGVVVTHGNLESGTNLTGASCRTLFPEGLNMLNANYSNSDGNATSVAGRALVFMMPARSTGSICVSYRAFQMTDAVPNDTRVNFNASALS